MINWFSATVCIAQYIDSSDFRRPDSIASLYKGHSLDDLRLLSHKLTASLSTEKEQFRAIFSWVCNNISNDYSYYEKNKSKREKLLHQPEKLARWNREFRVKVFDRLRNDYTTVCSGYAYLIRELAYYAGIECEIVDGYGRTAQANIGGEPVANHSWNTVKINKKWYLCDATWSSGSVDPQQKAFISTFSEAYFLTDPSMFVLNHYPLDTSKLYLKIKPSLASFMKAPLVYKGAIQQKVKPIMPETFLAFAEKNQPKHFVFKSVANEEIKDLKLQIYFAGKYTNISPEVSVNADGLLSVEYIFKSKGSYLVHIMNGADYLFTYKIAVK
ncbi:hypothetical protein GCM10011506_20440 [Marivirga lumbricoides]|uniref:Transglutaminase-like domain-containing protein n=2 Tax=Marivirga lumbricoides TaxID=1046115 RepID=A0ABQ1M5B6_9BACT|nr:hypothetical protein GCM10011506_20440 [Marivirga lumbricoides]